MIRANTRAAILERLKWRGAEEIAAEFKVSRGSVYRIRKGIEPKKGLAWERRREEIAAAARSMPVKDVAAKYGMSRARVYAILKRESGK